ncbi:hypothetical protein D9757_008831 [Collybiopsis confluens]|uniref:Uncharacterized protein n=1 Tax=Collybiopsis confluens TaxID=2823264 RepID=A0A8H5H3E2_9AGAR|nr:hypothetical protein D9757_008831 [Collybiopsis confluens]
MSPPPLPTSFLTSPPTTESSRPITMSLTKLFMFLFALTGLSLSFQRRLSLRTLELFALTVNLLSMSPPPIDPFSSIVFHTTRLQNPPHFLYLWLDSLSVFYTII